MRALRALLWLLLLLAVALPVAAWLVPPRLDLDRFRGDIASAAAARLGRSVTIGGRIALRLLPEPMLTASGIAIGSPSEVRAESISITAAELRLRLALGPLLEGRIDARELVLRGADVRLPWPLDPSQVMVRTPYWLSALSASVEDGKLSIGGLNFTGIDATLTTVGYGGSYSAAGTAQFSGRPWRFTARLTQPGGDGSAGLDVALDGQGPVQGIGATLSGQIGPDGTLTGRVSGRGPDLSHLIPAPPVSFKAEGRVTIAGGLAAADDLAMQIGGSPARGAVALRVSPMPRLDLALAASRLDLDAWLPVLGHTGPLPLPVGIDLSAEAATLAGGTLRGLRAAVDLSRDGAEVREARAVLPGEAPLRLSGHVGQDGGATPRPHFEGDVSISAPALRTTLAWLEQAGVAPFASLPDGVLRRAELSGHVAAEPGQFSAASLAGMVDSSQISGSFSLRAGKRLAAGAGLSVDRLDLDPWLPSGIPALPLPPGRFGLFDVDLRLEAKQAMFHGNAIAPLSLDAALEAGRLTLRKLDLQINSVHASASGAISEAGRVSEGHINLQVPHAAPLAGLLPDRLAFLGQRAPRLWAQPATVQVLASGPPEALGLKITADIADLRFEAQPTLNTGKGTWTSTVQLRHPGAPRLAEALGMANAGLWLGDGSLSLAGQLSGAATHYAADSFELTAGGLRATGAMTLDRIDAHPFLNGHIAAETLPLPLVDPRSLDPLPLSVLSGWDGALKLTAGHVLMGQAPLLEQASAALALEHGVLRLDGLSARLAGGALTGKVSLDSGSSPPAGRIDFEVSGAQLGGALFDWPLDMTAGSVDAGGSLTASGHAPATLLTTLGGEVRLSMRDGVLSGASLPALAGDVSEATARAALAGGETPFQALSLNATLASGVIAISGGEITAPSGNASLTGTIDLPGAAADLHLTLRPLTPDPPEVGLRLTGKLDAPRRMLELAGLTRWRAAHLAAPP